MLLAKVLTAIVRLKKVNVYVPLVSGIAILTSRQRSALRHSAYQNSRVVSAIPVCPRVTRDSLDLLMSQETTDPELVCGTGANRRRQPGEHSLQG